MEAKSHTLKKSAPIVKVAKEIVCEILPNSTIASADKGEFSDKVEQKPRGWEKDPRSASTLASSTIDTKEKPRKNIFSSSVHVSSTKKSSSGMNVSSKADSYRVSNNFAQKMDVQDVVDEAEEGKARKRKHRADKKKRQKQNKRSKNESSNSNNESSDSGSESSKSIVLAAGQVVFEVEVEGDVDSDTDDETSISLSIPYYTPFTLGKRNIHFDSEITKDTTQGILNDIRVGDYLYMLRSSTDNYVYGQVHSIDDTYCNIIIDADRHYLPIQCHVDKFQKHLRRPYSFTKMKRRASLSQILTHLSMSQGGVAAAANPNNGGVTFQFLPDEDQDTHIKRTNSGKRLLCTVINDDGDVCTKIYKNQMNGQRFCASHYMKYLSSKDGWEPTQRGDNDIVGKNKTAALLFYNKRIDHYYKSSWVDVESRDDPSINNIIMNIKSEVVAMGYRFLYKHKKGEIYYLMPEVLIHEKIINAFIKLDVKNSIPDELKYVDNDPIFAHPVVCEYSNVDPSTDDEMGRFLLTLQKKGRISRVVVVDGYHPDTTHEMNEEYEDGKFRVLWDSETVQWDPTVPKKVFKKYFEYQVFPDTNAKRSSSNCDIPTSVVHYQFEYEGRAYRMFLKSCLGKFGAFHQYAVPCDGSASLRINPKKKKIQKISPTGEYPTVGTL